MSLQRRDENIKLHILTEDVKLCRLTPVRHGHLHGPKHGKKVDLSPTHLYRNTHNHKQKSRSTRPEQFSLKIKEGSLRLSQALGVIQ